MKQDDYSENSFGPGIVTRLLLIVTEVLNVKISCNKTRSGAVLVVCQSPESKLNIAVTLGVQVLD